MSEQPAIYGNLFESIPQPAIHDLTDQMQSLLNADYSISDPSWDYAAVWTSIMELQQTLTALTEHLQQQEAASPETDKFIAGELFKIREEAAIATLLHFPNRYQSLPC